MIENEAELATVTKRLPEMFAGRVRAVDFDGLRSMADAGEWGELLDLLVAALRVTNAAITAEERDLLRGVLAGWGLPTDPVDDLAGQT